jgi:carboxymethylenebutenolidase
MADQSGKESAVLPKLEQIWADHLAGEFAFKDVEATLATMVDDASVNHVPSTRAGAGKKSCGRSIAAFLFHPGRKTCR